MVRIKLINHGIASRINDNIYIHKKILNKYQELYKAILNHEKEHSKDFEFKDILIDLKGKHLNNVKKEYYKFIITTPSSLTFLLPIFIYEKRIVFDPVILFLWLIIILMSLITLKIIL